MGLGLTNEYVSSIKENAKQEALGRGLAAYGTLVASTNPRVATKASVMNPLMRKLGPAVLAAFAVNDGIEGYNSPDLGNSKGDWRKKTANTIGGISSGLTMGLLPAKKISHGWYDILGGDSDNISIMDVIKERELQAIEAEKAAKFRAAKKKRQSSR